MATAPDEGIDEDTAHFYFCQLIDGLVRQRRHDFHARAAYHDIHSDIFTRKACVTGT